MRPETRKLILLTLMLSMVVMLVAQNVTFSVSPSSLKPGDKGVLKATLSIPSGKHQTYNPQSPDFPVLEVSHPDLIFAPTYYPKAQKTVSAEEWVYSSSLTLSRSFTVKASAKPGTLSLKPVFTYQMCFDTGMCEPPVDVEGTAKLTLAKAEAKEETKPEADSVIAPVVAGITDSAATTEPEPATPVKSPISKILKYLLLAFIGGVIMNFTPCVLPVLTIRAMSIVNQAHEDRSLIFKNSMAYAAGVMVSFVALAIVFIVLKLAGESVGWGFQFQSVTFTLVLTSIIFVFALALLDVFLIGAPGMTAASKASAKKGISGSFFGGVFAFLLATPCSAPLLGTAVGFAFSLPSWLMLVFFALIGLGMAFPFILIGLSPKALKIIPKPGEWMNIFKEVMAFVLFWLVYTMLKSILGLTSGDYLLHVLLYLVVLGLAAWMYGRFVRPEHSKATQWIFTLLTVLLVVFGAMKYLPYKEAPANAATTESGAQAPANHAPEGWLAFSPELMEKLLSEDAPVFVDFGAAWCKNCAANEKNVLFTDDILKAFKDKGVVLVRGDYTKQNPDMLNWMKKHQRVGVPFNALYVKGQETKLFSEILSKKAILDALNALPGAGK
ncbi:MAG TPA: thioredoxin family protein [Candidatus Cloacimonadota bacterium]|nr:thioredoxin family protein [Candidatus Cloacimonadota bacterium]HPS39711.1 thioredoxin family protein [Candidatus Cloacimonadota bacterium]